MDTGTETLLPLSIAARRLRVPVRWLRDECAAGRLPHIRCGRTIVVALDAIEEALLARARQRPTLSAP